MEQTPLGQGTSKNWVSNLDLSKEERQIIRRLAGQIGGENLGAYTWEAPLKD